ncbi:YciI family protein [Flavobacterium lindanitolerans]|nr:YciI family protein [Flavobacterium lindanitolerans]
MKKILLILMLVSCFKANAQTVNPNYDSKLAESLGADDYGMKMYVLAILKTGSNKIDDKEKLNELFKGHMDNINRLAKDGKLIVAGPLKKNDKNYRGIFILNAKTIEEANELLLTDPAIKEKLFEVEVFEWYGSAALPEYLKIHDKIEKTKH